MTQLIINEHHWNISHPCTAVFFKLVQRSLFRLKCYKDKGHWLSQCSSPANSL